MWGMDPEFKSIVQREWDKFVPGITMYQVIIKLKTLKQQLRLLNKNRYADIEKAAEVARVNLDAAQSHMHRHPGDHDIIQKEKEAAATFYSLQKARVSFLQQKAKSVWLAEGDENSAYFHRQIKARNVHNKVFQIKDVHGTQHCEPDAIEYAFLDYYQQLLGTSNPVHKVHVPTVRTGKLITPQHISELLRPISMEEVKNCLFSIPASNSPGPDGYTSQFFKDSWEILGKDLFYAINNFFSTGKLLKQLNSTNITLIPKIPNPSSVTDFRPIACCNTIYKCIAKLLCARLGKVLPDIVDCSQGGFIQGRNIVENVLICQDLVRLYRRKSSSPRCLVKIDLRKAYDSVEWDFLHQMLLALKFPQKFIDLVMDLKSGGQQPDFHFHPLCGAIQLNHLLFADDLLLFSKGDELSITWLLRSFATFSMASGLCLNKDKSEIYFNGMSQGAMSSILQVSGFKRGMLPFKYLGVPISSRKLTKADGMKLTDKITARIRSWGAKHLSYAGRLTLVNSVLSGLHSYWSSIFLIPNGILNKIDAICRNYLWGGKDSYVSAPNVKWENCCTPKEEGGLGLKATKTWNKASLGKYVWWLASKKDHLWVRWVNHVYMKGCEWTTYEPPVDCSWSWRKIAYLLKLFAPAYSSGVWLGKDIPYKVMDGYNWLRTAQPKVSWYRACWNTLNIPKTCYIYWAAMKNRLMTNDRLIRMGSIVTPDCYLCGSNPETHCHLFFYCCFSTHCIRVLQQYLHKTLPATGLASWFTRHHGGTILQKRIIYAAHVAVLYAIWRARNKARLDRLVIKPDVLVKQALKDVIARFWAKNTGVVSNREGAWSYSDTEHIFESGEPSYKEDTLISDTPVPVLTDEDLMEDLLKEFSSKLLALSHLDCVPCLEVFAGDSWKAQLDAIEAALLGNGYDSTSSHELDDEKDGASAAVKIYEHIELFPSEEPYTYAAEFGGSISPTLEDCFLRIRARLFKFRAYIFEFHSSISAILSPGLLIDWT
ncbi:uncharacterized protein LOC141628504 [Silene latifolia]|uniref:uncharacterized protein LOC141628504 n=1 Tax=Silene latifolia TaxID=37657 RepID=UPI003D785BB6